MIKEQELEQIRNYVIQVLPELLRQEPTIVSTIEGIVAHQFPRRDEFAQLLEQVNFIHKNVVQRFELQREEMRESMKLLREDVDRRFELQGEEIKSLREETKSLREEMKLLREDMDRRFELQGEEIKSLREETKSLREEMKLLREDMDRRFELQGEEIKSLREEMKLLREDMDKRFEQQHAELKDNKRRLIRLESAQQTLNNRMIGLDAWLKTTTGHFGTEKGQTLEELFALALNYGLNHSDIKPESIQLRQELVDTEGVIFGRKYFTAEIDLIAQNDKLIVFEMKATAKVTDVDFFSLKVELVSIQNPQQSVSGVFISPGAEDRVKQRCISLGLEFVG